MNSTSVLVRARILILQAEPRSGFHAAEAMLVEGGSISWVGHHLDSPRSDRVLDFGDRVVTPGLVDAHTHLVFGGNRVEEYEKRSEGATYEQIAVEGGGIRSTMQATRAASEDELVAIGKKHVG